MCRRSAVVGRATATAPTHMSAPVQDAQRSAASRFFDEYRSPLRTFEREYEVAPGVLIQSHRRPHPRAQGGPRARVLSSARSRSPPMGTDCCGYLPSSTPAHRIPHDGERYGPVARHDWGRQGRARLITSPQEQSGPMSGKLMVPSPRRRHEAGFLAIFIVAPPLAA